MTRRVAQKPNFRTSKLRYSRSMRVYNDTLLLVPAIAEVQQKAAAEVMQGLVPRLSDPEIIDQAVKEKAQRLGIDVEAVLKGRAAP